MNVRPSILLTLGLILSALLASACMETVYVDVGASGPGIGSLEAPFQRIATGLFWAASGATVHVAAGDYSENLAISRPVTLLGAGAEVTRILADVNRKGIEINADHVEVRGFSIVGVGDPDPENPFVGGIWAEDVNSLTVSENVVGPYAWIGIGVGRASNVTIEKNTVLGISGSLDSENQAIVLVSVPSFVVSANAISNVDGFGLYVSESGGELEMNTVTNCSLGIHVFASNTADAEVSVLGNTIENSSYGAMTVFFSTISQFFDNTIVNNPGMGLEIYDEETAILACGDNTLSGNNPDFGEYLEYYGYLDAILACLQ